MKRSYYSNTIQRFLNDSDTSIIGELTLNHSNRTLEELQKNAWLEQIQILKIQLANVTGQIYFEFAIPRMGKRVDNIVIIDDTAFIIEFKVGTGEYDNSAIEQVIDYTLDLQNFHQGSHTIKLIPVLVSTNARAVNNDMTEIKSLTKVAKCNKDSIKSTLLSFLEYNTSAINIDDWEKSIYKPTPTIVEAAQALYKGHSVDEISRSDSGAINLTRTTDCLNKIIDSSKMKGVKSICFVTGVPGAGKTLAGLNIANQRMKTDESEHAVFLSGNGPLVDVLREALARDVYKNAKVSGSPVKKKDAEREVKTFIQNIHHFRDEYLRDKNKPIEKVAVFDEAQRAWTKHQASSFMKRKKGIDDFNMSEPEFLIDVMDRHEGWCTVICLIGGGQEINTGEAGLDEWLNAFNSKYQDWEIYYSNLIVENKDYIKTDSLKNWAVINGTSQPELHLSISIRSFRSEKLSYFVQSLLDLNFTDAKNTFQEIKNAYPILLTRNLETAKDWVRKKAKGSERIGLIASSGARRLRPLSIDVKNEISAPNWFLNNKQDVRSSYYLEDVATEFDIQGLEIDWACVAWGANFYLENGVWKHQNFKGSKWMNINQLVDKEYLKNTYRVLLTRARQGFIIFLPEGSKIDNTRPEHFYESTYKYLKDIGIDEI